MKRSIVCAHVRTGRGETSTYLSFLDHAVSALVRHLRTRRDAPAVYLASDMPLGDIRKLRSRSKAVDELLRMCDGGGESAAPSSGLRTTPASGRTIMMSGGAGRGSRGK